MKLSYEQIRELIYRALPNAYIVELYDDHFIAEEGEKYYQVSYAIVDDELTLGDKVEVKRKVEYVKIQSAIRLSGAQDKKADDYGFKWKVRIVEFGTDKNKTYWTKEPLVASLSLFEGARVFMLSEAQHQDKSHPFGKPPTELIGWLSGVTADNNGIEAELNILKSADSLRDALVDSWERGNPDLLGLSLDLKGNAKKKTVAGQKVLYLEGVKSVTVDIVYDPAAGGKFLRMAAAVKAGQKSPVFPYGNKEGGKEAEMLKKLLAALKEQRSDLYATIEAKVKDGTVTEDEVIDLLGSAIVKTEDLDGRIKATVLEAVKAPLEELKASLQKKPGDNGDNGGQPDPKEILKQTRVIACGIILMDEIKGSELPELSQKKIEKQYRGKVFETEDLRAAINDEKEYVDKLTGSGGVHGAGDVRITETDLEARVKMLDDFFDHKVHSLKTCYIHLTGDDKVTGELKAASRLRASIDTTTFAQIFGDSVTRKMVKEYGMPGLDEWKKIVDIVPLADFRTNRRTRMGGYGDLPAVAQGGAYAALSSPGDEEATYAASKRGGTEDLTLEAIKNDDVGSIRRIPTKMSRAAKRTLHKFVFDFLKDNPTIYDSVALFHANHGNLGSAALDAANLTLRRQAMLAQTEGDSGEVLGIPPKFLIVPVELDKTAYDLVAAPRNSDFNPTAADFTRTLQLELIVVPYWTDANDWCLAANPADIPTIEIGFLDGQQEPSLYVQDMPNAGSMFTNDKLTYKIKHTYGGVPIEYRGLDKSVVA